MGTIRIKWNSIFLHIFLVCGSIIAVFPFLWMLSTSVKPLQDVYELVPRLIPKTWQWQNYTEVMTLVPFARFYFNSVFTSICRTIGETFFAAMAGYAFARLRFPGREVIFIGLLAVLMIPPQVTLIPNYILLKYLGGLDTYQGIILPRLYSAYGTFLFRQFFLSIPEDLIDAGKIDGCNPFQSFWFLAMPLSQSTLVAFGFLSLLYAWNDFLWPLIVIQSTKMNVLSVGIAFFQNQNQMNFPRTMAAATLAILPMVIIFTFVQRYIVEGITLSGLKG